MVPTCVKLLDHYAEDPEGTPYKLDEQHPPPSPGFSEDVDFQEAFDAALNLSPRDDLKTLLHRNTIGAPEVKSFSVLRQTPYKLSIALADLTGSKLDHPQYAVYNEESAIYPASLAKIAAIYAAHQLKFDALQKAKEAPADASSDPAKMKKWVFGELRKHWKAKGIPGKAKGVRSRQPDLDNILDADAGGSFVFTKNFRERMMDITRITSSAKVMNAGMVHLMKKLRLPYMGSAFLQSGLCKPQEGGIWIWSGWGQSWACKGRATQLYPQQRKVEVQAWSAATYLTLLAQERLISPETSRELKGVLHNGDQGWLKDTFEDKGISGVDTWGKHGMYEDSVSSASEGLLVERAVSVEKKIRYVVVCILSSSRGVTEYPVALAETKPKNRNVRRLLLRTIVELLIPALDGVIVANQTQP